MDKNKNIELSNEVRIVPYLLLGTALLFFATIACYKKCKGLNQGNGDWAGSIVGKKMNLGTKHNYQVFLESNISTSEIDTFTFSNSKAFKAMELGDFFRKKAGVNECVVTLVHTMDTIIFNPDSDKIDKFIKY